MDPCPIVERIFSELFNVPAKSLSLTTTRDDVSGWDSVAHLKLLLMLEDEGISLDPDEAVSLYSMGDIVAAIQRHGSRE